MKKISLLIVAVMLLTLLLAAAPPGRLLKLVIINKTSDNVYMKLQGKATKAYYYLTVKPGTSKKFTILPDIYSRTTWACGYQSTGSLIMTSNVKLNFIPCNRMNLKVVKNVNIVPPKTTGKIIPVPKYGFVFLTQCRDWTQFPAEVYVPCVKVPNMGEPTMEKVQYFTFYQGYAGLWATAMMYLNGQGLKLPCGLAVMYKLTFKTPVGCYFRYRY